MFEKYTQYVWTYSIHINSDICVLVQYKPTWVWYHNDGRNDRDDIILYHNLPRVSLVWDNWRFFWL